MRYVGELVREGPTPRPWLFCERTMLRTARRSWGGRMNIDQYTTEELLAIADALELPDPLLLRVPAIEAWDADTRGEVLRIGLRSLAACDIARVSESTVQIPDVVARLIAAICRADLVAHIAHVNDGHVEAVTYLVDGDHVAGQRPTPFGNHSFTLFPVEQLPQVLVETLDISDRPRSVTAPARLSLIQLRALTEDAAAQPDDRVTPASLQRAGITGHAADLLQALNVDGATATVVHVLHHNPDGRSVTGSVTSWVDAGPSGLWQAEARSSEGDEPTVEFAATTRDELMTAIAEGLPDTIKLVDAAAP